MAHPSVSRSHALLVVDKKLGAFLVDLGASNGSFVDGRVRQPSKPVAVVCPLLCIRMCAVFFPACSLN